MAIVSFQVDEKDGKFRFFEETFLLVDISINVAFGIPFPTLSNIEVIFMTSSSNRVCIPLPRFSSQLGVWS